MIATCTLKALVEDYSNMESSTLNLPKVLNKGMEQTLNNAFKVGLQKNTCRIQMQKVMPGEGPHARFR